MSDYLPVARDGLLPSRYERKLSLAVSRDLARVRAEEIMSTARIDAIETTGHVALSSVANLSAVELAYAKQNPYATARLKMTADIAAMAIGRRIQRLEQSL